MKKKIIIIVSIFLLIAISVVGFISFKLIQSTFISGIDQVLDKDAEGLYQYSGTPPQYDIGGCKLMPELKAGKYIFSETSSIQTASSTFDFTTKNVKKYYSSEGGCGGDEGIRYEVEVMQDGNIIDLISFPEIQQCPDMPNVKYIEKMYTDSAGSEIKAIFNVFGEVSGQVKCRIADDSAFVINQYTLSYPQDTFSFDIDTEFNNLSKTLTFNVDVNNQYHEFNGDVGIKLLIPNIIGNQGGHELIENNTPINTGTNQYTFSIEVLEDTTFDVVPFVKAYTSNSRISNLNGQAVFKESLIPAIGENVAQGVYVVNQNDYSNFLIGEFIGEKQRINTGKIVECNTDADCENGKCVNNKCENIIKQDYTPYIVGTIIVVILVFIIGVIYLSRRKNG